MPVWQGQDTTAACATPSTAWKLALVVNGKAGDAARQLPAGAPRPALAATVSAGLPPVKRYFLEMRFKPMPQYREALLTDCAGKTSPVGKMFIQPQVTLESGERAARRGYRGEFAIIGWGCNPQWGSTPGRSPAGAIGVRFIRWCRRCRSTASRITPRHAAGGRYAKSPEELVCSA